MVWLVLLQPGTSPFHEVPQSPLIKHRAVVPGKSESFALGFRYGGLRSSLRSCCSNFIRKFFCIAQKFKMFADKKVYKWKMLCSGQ